MFMLTYILRYVVGSVHEACTPPFKKLTNECGTSAIIDVVTVASADASRPQAW